MKLKILVINWQDISNPQGGGAEVHLQEIFKRIVAMGHEVTLLCCRYPNCKTEEVIEGIRIVRTGHRNFFNLVVPKAFSQLNNRCNFDVVVDDINKIPFFTPLFVKKPIVGIIHHLFGKSIFIEAKLPIAVYVASTEALVPRIYRSIPMTVVSESTKTELVSKGFSDATVKIIYNGVDLDRYRFLNETRNTNPLIGYLGRIKKYKSVNHLLTAFQHVVKEIPDARLIIMGDGDYLPQLEKLASKLGVADMVTFTGSADAAVKVGNLNRIWFTVNPSPKEGWGLTVIESNACGCPVIGANSPGLKDSIVNDTTGILYKYSQTEQLKDEMIRLIKDKDKLERLRGNCINWAQKFNWDTSAKLMIQLIEQTIINYQAKKQEDSHVN